MLNIARARAGDTVQQRSLEATDKVASLVITFFGALLSLQAVGLDIHGLLTISGFGGLALGLAGREILENLFNGLLIISSRSFEVGEEIMFTQARSPAARCTACGLCRLLRAEWGGNHVHASVLACRSVHCLGFALNVHIH